MLSDIEAVLLLRNHTHSILHKYLSISQHYVCYLLAKIQLNCKVLYLNNVVFEYIDLYNEVSLFYCSKMSKLKIITGYIVIYNVSYQYLFLQYVPLHKIHCISKLMHT